jgi:hypothetical protein
MSGGVGAAGRLHFGDSDGDGAREYGIGGDLGPFSVDFKTEDPLRSLLTHHIPFGLGDNLPGGNWTHGAIDAGRWVGGKVADLGGAIADGAGAVWDALSISPQEFEKAKKSNPWMADIF